MSEPQTETGKTLLRRGSNNWTGSDWQLTFAANIAKAEAQARDAALAEAEAAVEGLKQYERAAWRDDRDDRAYLRRDDTLAALAALRSGGAG